MSAGKDSPLTLVITRVFNAPRHLVFECWTEKEHLSHWDCPRGFMIESADAEFRVGGTFHTCMVAPDGTKHPLRGVYKEIVEDERLVFTHTWEEDAGPPDHETTVTVRFEDEGGKTKVTLEQSIFRSVESRDGHFGGWSECFDKLEEHLGTLG